MSVHTLCSGSCQSIKVNVVYFYGGSQKITDMKGDVGLTDLSKISGGFCLHFYIGDHFKPI